MTKNKTTEKEATAPTTKVADTKLCPKCGRTLSISAFPHDSRRKDGLYIYDRECEAKRQFEKYTKKMVAKAETNGIVVLKVNHAPIPATIDVLKIETIPTKGQLVFTTLATAE